MAPTKGDFKTRNEAISLLQNGILLETDTGLLCVPLSEALLSNLNLSEELLHSVASQLILQEDPKSTVASNSKNSTHSKSYTFSFESDGFSSSECSDRSYSTSLCQSNSTSSNISITKSSEMLLNSNMFESQECLNNIAEYQANVYSNHRTHNDTVGSTTNISKQIDVNSMTLHLSSDFSTTSNVSDSDTSVANFSSPSLITPHKTKNNFNGIQEAKTVSLPKRRGGWPKGRKRKPELLNLPPKAPATGYNLYLNEKRNVYKNSTLAFHEITKIIGNKWSNLTLDEKRPYLIKAEEDKKRYREELNKYRQSDAYRAYLNKKRKNRLQNNILSESDMDATDEIDEEDNEELYCRTCDQWFHNLHNKREHLQGRQHTQSVAGDMEKELGTVLRSSVTNLEKNCKVEKTESYPASVSDSISQLLAIVVDREKEIRSLKCRLKESQLSQKALWDQLSSLTERETKLKKDLQLLNSKQKEMENVICHLGSISNYLIVTDINKITALKAE